MTSVRQNVIELIPLNDVYVITGTGLLRQVQRSLCHPDELRAWFEPRITHIVGGDRVLAQALEGIDQCTALREHVGEASLAIWAAAQPVH